MAMAETWATAGLWIALALAASVISMRAAVSVALVEILLGVVGGNFLKMHSAEWINFLAGLGSVLLTFLAGAEIDPVALRKHLKVSLAIGFVTFLFHWGSTSQNLARLAPCSVLVVK